MMKNHKMMLFLALALIGFMVGYTANWLKNQIIENKINESDECEILNRHYSYFGNKSFFDEAYKNISTKFATPNKIKGVVVNHHLLAPHLIAEAINLVATAKPMTVVLISPNHFSLGRGQIISSVYDWNTPYGILESDCETISKLKTEGVLNIEEHPFKKEHGISGIVPFIKKSLPNSKIIPIIIKDTLPADDLDKFVESLHSILGEDALIVGSFDFSHVGPDQVAQLNDKKSISVIQNFDYVGLKKIEIDSIPGLEITLRFMEKVGALNFDLIANTNSAQILHDPTIKEVTSYVVGSFSSGDKSFD
jgi:AmmeMemoRadiSam system protein B